MAKKASRSSKTSTVPLTAGIVKKYTPHFCLDESKLRKLVDVVREHAAKLQFETFLMFRIERRNDSFYDTAEVDDVLSDDNASGREVRLLRIELHKKQDSNDNADDISRSLKNTVTAVEFDADDRTRVLLMVRGEDRDWCFVVADDLDAQIRRITHKPPWFAKLDTRLLDFLAPLLLVTLALFIFLALRPDSPDHLTDEQIAAFTPEEKANRTVKFLANRNTRLDFALPLAMLGMLAGMASSALRPVSRVLDALVRSTFLWGDMIPVAEALDVRLTRIKWGVGVGFGVSVVASIVAAAILKSAG